MWAFRTLFEPFPSKSGCIIESVVVRLLDIYFRRF